jgi:hypothetical protein
VNRGRLALVVAALAAVPLAVYRAVVFGGQTFVERDHLAYTLPVRTVLHEALRAGRFPEWWDGVGLGTPFAANPVHQAFSPIAWLCAALPMPLGADVEPIVYLFIAGLGTALLAMRLGAGALGAFVAGALVETSGYLGSMVVNGNMPHVAWVPWLAWAADRLAAAGDGEGATARQVEAAAVVALVSALQLLGAEPGASITAAFLAFAVVLARSPRPLRTLGWFAGAGAAGVALAAATLVPAVLLAASAERGGGLAFGDAAAWSLHPLRLLEWIWPRVLGDPIGTTRTLASVAANAGGELTEPSWSFSLFLGAPAILLAALGAERRRERALLAVAVAFLLLALGQYTPVFAAFRTLFPPERYMRYPEKHVLGAIVLVCAFAGAGITRVTRGAPRWAVGAFAGATAVLAALVAALVAASLRIEALARAKAAALGLVVDAGEALRVSMIGGLLALAALLVASAAAAASRREGWRRGAAGVLALATLAVSAHDAGAILSLAPREAVRDRPALLRATDGVAPGDMRIFRDSLVAPLSLDAGAYARWVNQTLKGDTGARFGFQVLPGMNPAESVEYSAFFSGRHGVLHPEALTAMLGIRFMLVDERAQVPLPGPVVARQDGVVLARASWVRPRAFVATGAVPAASSDEAVRALSNAGGRPPGVVVVEGEARGGPGGGLPAPCIVESGRPEVLELVCAAPQRSYAVLLDAWAPGWTATVDGAPAPVLRADGLFRAVPVEAGAHRIVLRYATPGLGAGAIVSLAAALVLCAAVWTSRKIRPTPNVERG